MKKLSIVISAYNEEANIAGCLESIKDLQADIIVVDNSSTDDTFKIAKKYTNLVFKQKNDPLRIDYQKNFGINKAESEWVLILDADERLTAELRSEIKLKIENTDPKISGYWIPRKNIIFSKVINNDMWSPDYQLRLFRKKSGRYADGVHRAILVNGETEKFDNQMVHYNYVSIHQYLVKLNNYTDMEVEKLKNEGYRFNWIDSIRFPMNDFAKTFFLQKGYKDGIHGLVLSMFQAFYMGIVFAKLWEKEGFPEVEEKHFLKKVVFELKNYGKVIRYWVVSIGILNTKNPIKKILFKVVRRVNPPK